MSRLAEDKRLDSSAAVSELSFLCCSSLPYLKILSRLVTFPRTVKYQRQLMRGKLRMDLLRCVLLV